MDIDKIEHQMNPIWYRVSKYSDAVEEVEVGRETEHCVWIAKRPTFDCDQITFTRSDKANQYVKIVPTLSEATELIRVRTLAQFQAAVDEVERTKELLGKIGEGRIKVRKVVILPPVTLHGEIEV